MHLHPTEEYVQARNALNIESTRIFQNLTVLLEQYKDKKILKVDGTATKAFRQELNTFMKNAETEFKLAYNNPLQAYVSVNFYTISVDLNVCIRRGEESSGYYLRNSFGAGSVNDMVLTKIHQCCIFKSDYNRDDILALISEKRTLDQRLSSINSELNMFFQ